MTLYRKNIQLSQELFSIISCFEIALRNAIDVHYLRYSGADWLHRAALPSGMFNDRRCQVTQDTIRDAMRKLGGHYSHNKLVAELGFGFWRYMFAPHQFLLGGRSLLAIFPSKPSSTPSTQYNAAYIFSQLSQLNILRNRIAHHEPLCFLPRQSVRSTSDVRFQYALVCQLLQWMNIDKATLFYGLDHINSICDSVDAL